MKKLWMTTGLAALFVVFLIVLSRIAASIATTDDQVPAPPAPKPAPVRKLIIVGEPWAPFEYLDDGQTRGIDAEVLERIFTKLGVDYEIQFYPWSRAWLMAQNGKADAVISVSYKKSREKYLLYTDSQRRFVETGAWPAEYLWSSEYVFFCRQIHHDSFRFESYTQIKQDGYRLATIQDYSYNREFRAAQLQPTAVVPDQDAGYRLLAAGEVDLFPNEKTVGLAALKRLGLRDKITIIAKPMFRKPYLLPFCRQSDYPDKEELMRTVYRELNAMRASGEYEKIYQKYIPPLRALPELPD